MLPISYHIFFHLLGLGFYTCNLLSHPPTLQPFQFLPSPKPHYRSSIRYLPFPLSFVYLQISLYPKFLHFSLFQSRCHKFISQIRNVKLLQFGLIWLLYISLINAVSYVSLAPSLNRSCLLSGCGLRVKV